MKKLQSAFKRLKKTIIVFAIALSVLFSAAFTGSHFEISKHLDIFATLFRQLHVHYVDDVNTASLMKTAIDEMLKSLDPYTNFISEDEIEDFRFMTTGQYGGIGALIHNRDDFIVISEPYYDFPAQKAGLFAGDKILEVNGRDIKGMSSADVRNLLRGQPGTTVSVLIDRYGKEKNLEIDIVREDVKIDNIPFHTILDNNVGYIKLAGFTENAGRETKDIFQNMKATHNIEKIILDLRGNGGGLLNEAVNVANIFLDKDLLIVSTKGKLEERNTRHRTLNTPVDTEMPLVVLIDRGSASASEIVAGAIQDYDRGLVIGQRSFGKGLVQNVVPLSYNSRLKVTVAKYYIPSGRCIQAVNYAERNEDGSVSRIPDSLKVAFETKGGRTVYDGGGIEPDVFVEPERFSKVSASLINNFLIFDFATKFFFNNDSILPAGQFEITDPIYKAFLDFIEDKDFDYETRSERKINELLDIAQEEQYDELIGQDIEQLRQSLLSIKEDDLINFEEEIRFLLQNEIIGRYYYQRGRIKNNLNFDKGLIKAQEILLDMTQYASLLNDTIQKH